MKKTVEFNTRFNLGDIVYGIDINNKSTKAKITSIVYNKKDTVATENYINEVNYEATLLDGSTDVCYIYKHSKNWFKSKDELIDYLKTQIDRVTTDDYTINYEAH